MVVLSRQTVVFFFSVFSVFLVFPRWALNETVKMLKNIKMQTFSRLQKCHVSTFASANFKVPALCIMHGCCQRRVGLKNE